MKKSCKIVEFFFAVDSPIISQFAFFLMQKISRLKCVCFLNKCLSVFQFDEFQTKIICIFGCFFTKYYYHLALKRYILNNISFNNMHIHNFWQYVLWSAFFFLQCHSNYVNYFCILWEDNIWIKDQLVHITILNVSFESLKYIQEYYMISNWINYYLDSYVVENLCMENLFSIHFLIYV